MDSEATSPRGSGVSHDAVEGRKKKTITAALIITIGAAAVLRLAGIKWGLPGETHLFSYHPDEYFSLSAALSLFIDQDPNPQQFFNYPSLYLYLVAAICMPLHGWMPLDDLSQLPGILRAFTLDARLMTVILALATVLVTYGVGKRLAGRRAGILAAFFVAVAPGHVLYSHFAAVDVALTFFVTLALYASMVLMTDERLKIAALAGVAVGAAAATKYNGALAMLMPLIVLGKGLTTDRDKRKAHALRVGAVVLLAVVAFAALSPYVFFDWEHASRDIAFERDHMKQGEYPANAADPCGWWFQLRALAYSVGGSVPLVAVLALFAYGMRGRLGPAMPLIVFAALWYLMIGATGVRYARYGLPLIPLLAIGASAGLVNLARGKRSMLPRIALVVVVLPALLTSTFLSASLAFEAEPRDAALAELQATVPAGETIGVGRTVWFDMPPLDYNNGADTLGNLAHWASFRRSAWDLETIAFMDAADLAAKRPKWFVESDFQFADWLRAEDEKAVAFREALEENYSLASTHERKMGWHVLGPCGPLPHDWSYPFTTIRVWRANSPED
ncbi:MAG TPA: glycosyltransferase family 39 protein [Armatimonadota bacterium]|nr:glycosyltransferase family 39 protein [Armatimonadota bacterium]